MVKTIGSFGEAREKSVSVLALILPKHWGELTPLLCLGVWVHVREMSPEGFTVGVNYCLGVNIRL